MPSLLAKMEKRTLMRDTCCLICMLKVPASMLRRSTVFNVVTSTSLRLTPRLYWEVLPVWLASLFALRFHQQCMPLVSDHSCCVYIIFDPYIMFMLLCCSLFSWYQTGRVQLSKGYAAAEGDPMKRYEARFAKWMWYGFLGNVLLGMGSCGLIMAGKKKLWVTF